MDLRNEGFNFYGMMSNAYAKNKRTESHLGDVPEICSGLRNDEECRSPVKMNLPELDLSVAMS